MLRLKRLWKRCSKPPERSWEPPCARREALGALLGPPRCSLRTSHVLLEHSGRLEERWWRLLESSGRLEERWGRLLESSGGLLESSEATPGAFSGGFLGASRNLVKKTVLCGNYRTSGPTEPRNPETFVFSARAGLGSGSSAGPLVL